MRRRAFVTITGGGLAGILASGRAPAFGQASLGWAESELKRIYEA